MICDSALRTQAYFDGEMDSAGALEAERHLESCAECRALAADIEAIRGAMRGEARYHRADAAAHGRIRKALGFSGTAARRQPWYATFWAGLVGGVGATGLAAALAFALLVPEASDALLTDVTNAHLRSIASGHLIDVASTDRHTVKPWLAAHADLSPPVADFSHEGFTLIGGRVDFVDGARAAVSVYRHGAHIINVFAWTHYDGDLPRDATRNGYHIVFWRQGNLVFCAISDIALDDMLELSRLLKAATLPDGRE